jgi:uncharacterized protein with PIN domain
VSGGELAEPVPPLLADAMLGRLARWLRLAGYDTAYLADTDDLEVVRLARAEGRLILTRDGGLAARKGVQTLMIHSQQVEEQLAQVREQIGSPGEDAPARCSVCNVPLDALSAEAARNRVPPYVFRTQTRFMECASCRRVYWPGTHWQAIQAGLDEN